ncbi:MAG: tetratricopeptide repeat protein, partial [Pseudonocardiaceae bacterium]
GRARLAQRAQRPSPKGLMPLADWVVPVHYARREVRFPDLQARRPAGVSLDDMLDRLREPATDDPDADLAAADGFVGRDGLFYTLEAAARLQRVVLLHGPGGTGKTELARAFGRWWRDTGGVDRPDWVIWHSFEPGVASFGLDGVLAAIGLRVFGADFARLDSAQRRAVIVELLTERRLLLIWDNFEAVHSMPDPAGATPPLPDADRDELAGFLHQIADSGRSAVLITSRSEETWLGELRRIPVGGLAPDEAIEYTDQVLAPYPAAQPRRARRAFAELMDWLDGHPLSMRLVLPHLETTDLTVLLAGLRGLTPLPGSDNGGRTTSLAASVTYSFAHLSPDTRRLLVAVSLFQGVADVDVLGAFSQVPDVPQRFHGHATADWAMALDQATSVGLLTRLGGGMYGIHPALPAYLAEQWRREGPDDYPQQRATANAALLDAYATLGDWLLQQIQTGDAAFAFQILDRQRRTLANLLGYALDHSRWDRAQAIAQPLDEYWNARGLLEEARGWVDRARLVLGTADGSPPPLEDSAGALWLFLVGSQAKREYLALQLDDAERTYLKIRAMLQAQPKSPEQQHRLAVTYHQLGMVAQDRGQLDDAEHWYHQSLTIAEKLGNRPGMASTYHQLGIIAHYWGQVDNAESWCRQSLTIKEELGNRPGMALTYNLLGIIARSRENYRDAENWCRQALTIDEEFGNRPGMARIYHELGSVAQLRGRFDDAEHWYHQSLTINEELGNRPGMAANYHQLGMVAQERGRFDEAEHWYHQSLTIEKELGHRSGMALSFGQLGLLAEARGRADNALEWAIRCITVFDEFPHPMTRFSPTRLARLTTELGVEALERCWLRVTNQPLPPAVRDFIAAGPDQDAE